MAGDVDWKAPGTSIRLQQGSEYRIAFNDVPYNGYIPPITHGVMPDHSITVEVDYNSLHQLTVNIEPEKAATGEVCGMWKLEVEDSSAWKQSGTAVTLHTGYPYTVQFKDAPGWITPEDATGEISTADASETGTYIGVYQQLKVSMIGASATNPKAYHASVEAEALWTTNDIDIGLDWYNSGHTCEVQYQKDFTVSFSALEDWQTPKTQEITMPASAWNQEGRYEMVFNWTAVNMNAPVSGGVLHEFKGELWLLLFPTLPSPENHEILTLN
ncbi:MAG: hypothetical protein PHQ23_06410 [Candidatus Wallbacteria bacterium]|nr:hypothetical protein [Candidatus Wallbacteria bacterium]